MPPLPVSDPVLIFAITMVIILVAPLIVIRLRIPGLVGLILAGTVVGPSVLGLLERDATFELLGTVGLLYLMFMAGVTLDLGQFSKFKGRSVAFGAASFFIPQIAALLVGLQVLGWSLPQALLLGSIVGSHTLLAYPIADRLGITDNRGIVMAVGATMVTDILSLVILAVVIAAHAGDANIAFWLRFGGLVAAWAAVAIIMLPRLGAWFYRNVRQGPAIDFAFLMAVLFITAWVADVVGLAPIIGAFMAGLLMNRLVPAQSPLMTRIKFVGDALLIPFFLISVGMLIDVAVLVSSFELWLVALLFTALVVFGKSLAAKGSQLVFGLTSSEGWSVAGLTIPQAAATLAVTLVGFDVGLFDELVVNAVVVMILLTSLAGPWLVERFGRAVALAEKEQMPDPADAPERILVPLANPETAPALMDVAISVRDPGVQQPVYPLAVARAGSGEAAAVASCEKLLAHAVIHAAAADVPVVPLTRVDQNVARGIGRAVVERRISTVIIGWNGESSARARVFGSVLDQFLEETRTMVLVSKLEHPLASVQRLLLLVPPFAEREPGFPKALAAVKTLAGRTGASLGIVAVDAAVDDLQRWVQRTDPEVRFRMHRLAGWGDLISSMNDIVREGDLICLLSTRRGTLAWRPSLLRAPGLIAARWPDRDFITVYLSEAETEAIATAAADPTHAADELPHLPLEHITLDLPTGELSAVLQHVVGPAFPQDPDTAASLARQIESGQVDYAPELTPGLVFYHLHSASVKESALFVGLSREGLSLPQTSQPVHVVMLLLAPLEMSPGSYLRRLALTAHLIQREDGVQEILSARTAEEVHRTLFVAGARRLQVAAES